ncbi:hypothetical protein J5N97_020720 [Dioscorea zingiberensis]|uniref:Uncharacterized protein n=1 Tax=Dioscorea zingiberensis TaxID=325984 RepID=A0A9D5CGC8_9LILI|nr:hypothetical protein J5N97_020720 [Dioscorea zingiberensis]
MGEYGPSSKPEEFVTVAEPTLERLMASVHERITLEKEMVARAQEGILEGSEEERQRRKELVETKEPPCPGEGMDLEGGPEARTEHNGNKIQTSSSLRTSTRALPDTQDMRNCYDSLLSAATATANSAYGSGGTFKGS